MNLNTKNGFTLVELMIVVIILGLLAAVALPKLFGSVAKAKSTELPVAASTYIKLQDAALGAHSEIGNWKFIGYIAPATNGQSALFKYDEGEIKESIKIEELGEGKVGWQATNTAALNDCNANNWWNITVTPNESNHVNYVSQVSSTGCISIASSFTQGNISDVGSTESGNTGHVIGNEIIASGNATLTAGRWHEQNGFQAVNGYSAWKAVMVSGTETEGTWKGTVELEPNSEYTFTISVPEDQWDASKGQFLQTEIRVYTEEPNTKLPAIMLGSRPDDQKPAEDPKYTGWVKEDPYIDPTDNKLKYKYPNGNGYNNGSGRNNGYDAEATMKTENGTVTTTVTIKTGAEGGHLAANVFTYGEGWTAGREEAANKAIKNVSLVKTGDVTPTTSNK